MQTLRSIASYTAPLAVLVAAVGVFMMPTSVTSLAVLTTATFAYIMFRWVRYPIATSPLPQKPSTKTGPGRTV